MREFIKFYNSPALLRRIQTSRNSLISRRIRTPFNFHHTISFIAVNVFATLFVLAGLGGCGTNDSGNAEKTSELKSLAVADPLFCPKGFSLELPSKTCVNTDTAAGPFTKQMQADCTKKYGAVVCESSSWPASIAREFRSTGDCPPGAAKSGGVCVEGKEAFGPFSQRHVEKCSAAGGGTVCTTSLRWDANFAKATLPPSAPNPKRPWTWVANTDYGLRQDSGGLGYFKAARGGGTRVHKGLDLLYPMGTPLLTPCNGRAENGYESGYGNYVVVYCKIPSSVIGGNTVTVSFLYGHLKRSAVKNGAAVSSGQMIGEVGKSGNASSSSIKPHVHFETRLEAGFSFDEIPNSEDSQYFDAQSSERTRSRSMIESESAKEEFSREESEHGIETRNPLNVAGELRLFSLGGFLKNLDTICLSPFGFKALQGINYSTTIDPFVLLSCLAAKKPALEKSSIQSVHVPWSKYYSAKAFDVNSGLGF
jgi:murein DD-endopeptidase MepM/ murein hydrolase activator NlpD